MTDLSAPANPHQREENSGVIHTRRPSKTGRTTFAAKRLLAAIEQLTPEIIARAAEIEAGRCIPRDLVDTLRSLGVFRMFVPESHGGLELDLPSGLAVIKALATALQAQGTQSGIWIAATCVRVAAACFTLAGGSAVYESSPLQRRMRDLHAAAQHASIHQRHYVNAGKALLSHRLE